MSLRVLRPRVGKEDPDLVDRRRHQTFDEDQGVTFDNAEIDESKGVNVVEKASDSRTMDVDRYETHVGQMARHMRRQVAIAGTDLETHRRIGREQRAKVDGRTRLGQSEPRQQFGM